MEINVDKEKEVRIKPIEKNIIFFKLNFVFLFFQQKDILVESKN